MRSPCFCLNQAAILSHGCGTVCRVMMSTLMVTSKHGFSSPLNGGPHTHNTPFPPAQAILGLAALLGIGNPLELANTMFANATEEITQQLIIPGG